MIAPLLFTLRVEAGNRSFHGADLEHEKVSAAGKIHLIAIALLFLLSLLVLFPAPTYTLWQLEIIAAER